MQAHDLGEPAFERDWRFKHARHVDDSRRDGREAGQREFVDVGRHGRAAGVHAVGEGARGQVPAELTRFLDVADGVLVADAGEADDRGRVVEGVEKAVRRQIEDAVAAARRDPADGAGADDGVEGIVWEAVAGPRFVEMDGVVHRRHDTALTGTALLVRQFFR
jgi:hypothetical protein